MNLRSRSIFVGVLIVCLCVCTSGQPKPITLSYNTNALNVTLPILVAQELGFFAAEGLEVTAVFVRSGPTAMTALVSGSSDYTTVGSTTVIQAIAKGVPAVVIGRVGGGRVRLSIGGRRVIDEAVDAAERIWDEAIASRFERTVA